jgi:zinc transport system permease protein
MPIITARRNTPNPRKGPTPHERRRPGLGEDRWELHLSMMDTFVVRAVLGGIGVAAVAGPLGCFVVWRRMSYFGDSLAHSALLGVALGALMGIDLNLGILASFLVFSLLLVFLQSQQRLATDTILGILAHTALSLGLVALSFLRSFRVDLLGYLFGDILAVTWLDLLWIYGGGALALITLFLVWPHLLFITVHEELARAEGTPITLMGLVLMILIAVVTLIAMKIIGILLITSLLIIPAAAARRFSRTPEQMAVVAAGLGILAVLGGLLASMTWDTPSGPSVVVAAAVLFAVSQIIGWLPHLFRSGNPG